jgi:hypothetical protein
VRVLRAPQFYYTPATLSLHLNAPQRPPWGCLCACSGARGASVHSTRARVHACACCVRIRAYAGVHRGCLPCGRVRVRALACVRACCARVPCVCVRSTTACTALSLSLVRLSVLAVSRFARRSSLSCSCLSRSFLT